MLAQIVGCPKEFMAYLALEPFLLLVSEHVLVKAPFSSPLELFSTYLTRQEGCPVFHLPMDFVILLVSLPAELTLEFSVASITFIRHVS